MICRQQFPAALRCSAGFLGLALVIAAGCGVETSNPERAGSRIQTVGAVEQRQAATVPRSVPDLDEHSLEQLCGGKAKAVVFVFTRTECPIANRYSPEIRRLYEKFSPQGVSFQLIYPEASDSATAIAQHLAAFEYPCQAWRDPTHVAVRRFGPRVTPEVAVFDCGTQQKIYRGRIDDLYVDFGQARQAATTHDLEDALEALVSGRQVRVTTTDAVGCLISDLP